MTNQRHRRYKQAVNSNNVDVFMTDVLRISQGSLDFKANSISPGTEFMYELIRHMEFFVKRKLHEDPNWRRLRVGFSPGSVPGEGEHKIMDFLRGWAQSPEYSARDVHCVYGNDSDLVLLSLKLHVPNVIILREANRYVDKDTVVNHAAKRFVEDDPFEIIYVNLLREYLYLEFALPGEPGVEQSLLETHAKGDFKLSSNARVFNAERFIDDFVFLSCFIGNDFLPQLYCLSTKLGHFDLLLELLRGFYRKHKRFLVFREKILWASVRLLLAELRRLEERFIDDSLEMFRAELRRFDKKRRLLDSIGLPKGRRGQAESMQTRAALQEVDLAEKDLFLFQYQKEYAKLARAKARIEKMVALRNQRTARREFYYFNYFADAEGRARVSKSVEEVDDRIGQFCRNYFEGMRFKHLYYTLGCPTWVWYFRFENCPLVSDMYHFLDELFQEDLLSDLNFAVLPGRPFRPFVQLLHILPKQSLGLLPPLFQRRIFEGTREEGKAPQETEGPPESAGGESSRADLPSNLPGPEPDTAETKSPELGPDAGENQAPLAPEDPEPPQSPPEPPALSKKERFMNRGLIPTPLSDEQFLGFNFEGDAPSAAELAALGEIEEARDFHRFFPKKFMVEALDNLKNYTWIPLICDIDRAAMQKFVLEFPWSALSEAERARNQVGKDKWFAYDKDARVQVVPELPGFAPFEARVSERVIDWAALWGKDPRKLDRLYLKKEKMLALTRFRLPSFISAFGGFGQVRLNLKVKFQREVAFLNFDSAAMLARMTRNPLQTSLEVHAKVTSGASKIKVEHLQKLQAKARAREERRPRDARAFRGQKLLVQNKLVFKERKRLFLGRYQDSCVRFLLNGHSFQKLLYFDELFPQKLLFVRSEWVTGKTKDKAIHGLLKKLSEEFFVEVSDPKALYRAKKVLRLFLGTPSFSVMEVKQHALRGAEGGARVASSRRRGQATAEPERGRYVPRESRDSARDPHPAPTPPQPSNAQNNTGLGQQGGCDRGARPQGQSGPGKKISFSLQWKEEGTAKAYPLSMVFEAVGFKTIFEHRESLDPLPPRFSLSSNRLEAREGELGVAVDLTSGNLLRLGPQALDLYRKMQSGERFGEVPRVEDYEILRVNERGTRNLKLESLSEKMFAVDAQLLFDLGFSREEKWLVWTALDSLLVYCDKQQSSSLVLGMKFDVGLNLMNLLNRRTHEFTTVSDMASVYLEENFDLSTHSGLQRLLDSFLGLKFLHMHIFFQEEGKALMKLHVEKPGAKGGAEARGKTVATAASEEQDPVKPVPPEATPAKTGKRQGGKKRGKRKGPQRSQQDAAEGGRPKQSAGEFLEAKNQEYCETAKLIKSLVGKKRYSEWKRRVAGLRRQARGKRRGSRSLELGEVRAFFDIENEPGLLSEILADKLGIERGDFPRLRLAPEGFADFSENIRAGFFADLEIFVRAFPAELFVSLENWKVKTFSLYLSQRGLSALQEFLAEHVKLVRGLRSVKGRLWKLEQRQNDGFAWLKIKNRFRVRELFPQYYRRTPATRRPPAEPLRQTTLEAEALAKRERDREKARAEPAEQMDEEMTLNLKSMLGLNAGFGEGGGPTEKESGGALEEGPREKGEEAGASRKDGGEKQGSALEQATQEIGEGELPETKAEAAPKPAEKAPETDTKVDTVFQSLLASFGDKVVTEAKPASEEAIGDANIELFHCYANILKKAHSNLFLQPALSRHYSIDTIAGKILEKPGRPKKPGKSGRKPAIKVTHLIAKAGHSSVVWPPLLRKPPFHSLGDRVVHINPDNPDLGFGLTGTVIGLYKQQIEVVVDRPVIGADDLAGRVPAFRGKMLGFFDVFNLSKWRSLVVEEKHLASLGSCWQGEYDFGGLIAQIKKDSRQLKRKTYWGS